MKKYFYTILYAIANICLIFAITYLVFFVLEALRLTFVRFYYPGTQYSMEGGFLYTAVETIVAVIIFPVCGTFYVVKYVAVLTLLMPICHVIEMIMDKSIKINYHECNQYNNGIFVLISMIIYLLVGIGSLYVIKTQLYADILNIFSSVELESFFSSYQLANILKIVVYILTLVIVLGVSYFTHIGIWINKKENESQPALKWVNFAPLICCVLSIVGIVLICFWALGFGYVEERHYYV